MLRSSTGGFAIRDEEGRDTPVVAPIDGALDDGLEP